MIYLVSVLNLEPMIEKLVRGQTDPYVTLVSVLNLEPMIEKLTYRPHEVEELKDCFSAQP